MSDVVLQERVRTAAVDRHGRQLPERVGGTEHEREEEQRHHEAGDDGHRHQRVGRALAELHRDEREVAAEDHRPQEDRSLERGPQSGDRVEERGAGRVVLGDVAHREVVADQRPLHHAGGGDGSDQDPVDAATPEAQEHRIAQLQPGEERGDADHRGAGTECDRRVSERGLHAVSLTSSAPGRCSPWAACSRRRGG